VGRSDVVAAARGYVGTPFKHQGRLPGVGLDCVGLVICALREAGYACRDTSAYSRWPKPSMMRRELLTESRQLERGETMQPADVMWFRIKRNPQHLGLYDGDGGMIHAFNISGRVEHHALTPEWLVKRETILVYRGFEP